MPVFCVIDDKYVPIYRMLWIAAVPHYCGSDDCQREGQYEIRLEGGESLWASPKDRDTALKALEAWSESSEPEDPAHE